MILGIDFGASSTDAVLVKNNQILKKASFSPPISLKQLEGKLAAKKWPFEKIGKAALTGGKASEYRKTFHGIPAVPVNEIKAIALGALAVAGKKSALVVSLGTGTCIVNAKTVKDIKHVSGTGIGGGTLLGLSELLLKTRNLEKIKELASKGSLEKVDLKVGDIVGSSIKTLSPELTASNFAKLKSKKKEDIALALLNLVAESNGVILSLSAKHSSQKTIIATGKLVTLPWFKKRLKYTAGLYNLKVLVPKHGEVATAFGAALFLSQRVEQIKS